jgi:hypothetical protein
MRKKYERAAAFALALTDKELCRGVRIFTNATGVDRGTSCD